MFKKTLGTLALAGLLLTGLSVSQANAAVAYVSDANMADAGASFSTDSTNTTSVVLPANSSNFHSEAGFNFTEAFLLAHAGQALSFTTTVLDPSSQPVTLSQHMNQSSGGYSTGVGGYLSKNGGWVSVDFQTSKLNIPADATGYQGSYNPYVDVTAANAASGGTLAAGTYTVTFTLLADTTPITQETGLTVDNLSNSFYVNGSTFVVPQGNRSTSLGGTACVDPAKVALGDVIKAELYVDDAVSINGYNYWETRSKFKSQSDAGYRSNTSGSTVTVTQYDIDNGLGVRISASLQNALTAGSEHHLNFKLFNPTTIADVSGDCSPAKPATPSASYSMNSLRVSGTFSFGSEPYNVGCYAYDKTAPTVVAATAYSNYMPGSDQISCSFSGLLTGHTYFAKVQTYYYNKGSAISEKTADVLIPAGGYTFTTNYAGVVAAGKVVKVSDNVLPLEDLTNYTQNYSDGKGGLYTVGAPNTCNITCGISQVRIRHFNADRTLDGAFGGPGSIVLNSFAPVNSYVSGMGYFGTNKEKWILPVSGYESNGIDQKIQFIMGESISATTTSKSLTKDQLNTACNAGATGYSVRPNYAASAYVYSAPVANPFIAINCQKEYTLADNSKQWLSLAVLTTLNPATGALTVKGTLGTPSANANTFLTRTTTNPDATGTQPMLTAFVSSLQYTGYSNNNFTGTVADHSIIRISADGTFLSTTGSAWGAAGGPSATEAPVSVPPINSGKIYAIVRSGMSSSLLTVASTGVATSIAIDATASTIMGGFISPLSGYSVASNETLIPVSVSGMTELAAAWINSSTGVLTLGEKLAYTSTPGNGIAMIWLNGNDKNTYLLVSASNAPANLTVLKWIDSRYTAGSSAATQTITLTGKINPEVDLDGIDLVASTTSGLALTFATSTPSICSVDSAAHVTAVTTGECVVTASQAGNASYLSATQSVTITFVAAATTPVVDNGNPAQPTVAPKTGTWVQNGDTSVAWNRTKGTLGFKINVVYIGPIKATGVFKVGSKSYTCSVNFGILKKQATNKRLTLTSPNLCSGAKEKTQLAALKKAPANTVVKITFVRDMRLPTTYAKIRNKTRVIYVKLG